MPVDHQSPIPVYRQVADVIAARIASGQLRPGRPIPSEKQLIDEFGIARDTARRAVWWLREQGLVRTYPQKGSFVLPIDT